MTGVVVLGVVALFLTVAVNRRRRTRAMRSEAHLRELAAALGKVLDEAAAADRVGVCRTEVVAGRDAATAVTTEGVVLADRVERSGNLYHHELLIGGVGIADARFILSAIVVLLESRTTKLVFTTHRARARVFTLALTLEEAQQRTLDAARLGLPEPSVTATLDAIRVYETFLAPCGLFPVVASAAR